MKPVAHKMGHMRRLDDIQTVQHTGRHYIFLGGADGKVAQELRTQTRLFDVSSLRDALFWSVLEQ
jgi:hypothetical protein